MVNRAKGRTGLNPLAYMGVEPSTPTQFVTESFDPTPTDWQNFNLGAVWLNTSSEAVWFLVSLFNNQATWIQLGGSSGTVITLTGNTGGAVSPLAGNINVVGDGVTIQITGNPGSHTLTASAIGTGLIQTITGNDGVAEAPIAGNFNFLTQNATVKFRGTAATETLDFGLTTNLCLGNSWTSLTTAVQNTGLGQQAGVTLTSGNNNTVLGWQAGSSITNSSLNTFIGSQAGKLLTGSSNSNTAVGASALASSLSGSNTAIGATAGGSLTTGSLNVLVGTSAGFAMTTASGNVFIGSSAATSLLTSLSGGNVGIGTSVLSSLTTGSFNIALGNLAANSYTGSESSNIIIGSQATIGDNTTLRIGSASASSGGNVNITKSFVAGIYNVTPGSGTTLPVIIDSNGQLGTGFVQPSLPAFSAYVSADQNNVTGDGTAYTVIFDTELADYTNSYNNATGVFTAPLSGLYSFQTTVGFSTTNVNYSGTLILITTPHNYEIAVYGTPGGISTVSDPQQMKGALTVLLTAGDTVSIQLTLTRTSSLKTIDVLAGAPLLTVFSGFYVG